MINDCTLKKDTKATQQFGHKNVRGRKKINLLEIVW